MFSWLYRRKKHQRAKKFPRVEGHYICEWVPDITYLKRNGIKDILTEHQLSVSLKCTCGFEGDLGNHQAELIEENLKSMYARVWEEGARAGWDLAGKLDYGEGYTPTQYLPKALRDRNTYAE